MDMVCKQLSSPDANGVQSCLQWGQADLYLPPLSYAEATTIGGAFWLCLAVVWSLKLYECKFLKSKEFNHEH